MGYVTDLTEEQYAAVYDALSPSRKAHIDRMKHDDARRRSLAATYVMGVLLARRGISAPVETDSDGKPFLKGMDMCISMSHSADAVACAVSDKPVGIDIERIRSVDRKLIDYVCNEREREYADTPERFFEVWTAKEASYKCDGGVTPLRAIDTLSLQKLWTVNDGYGVTIVYSL